jgi:hypothetical protein
LYFISVSDWDSTLPGIPLQAGDFKTNLTSDDKLDARALPQRKFPGKSRRPSRGRLTHLQQSRDRQLIQLRALSIRLDDLSVSAAAI